MTSVIQTIILRHSLTVSKLIILISYFPDCAYTLIGSTKNRDGKVCAVLSQPYIISGREATEEEASPNKVLVGIDGNLYFIDTIIYRSDDANPNSYHKQSPQYQ